MKQIRILFVIQVVCGCLLALSAGVPPSLPLGSSATAARRLLAMGSIYSEELMFPQAIYYLDGF